MAARQQGPNCRSLGCKVATCCACGCRPQSSDEVVLIQVCSDRNKELDSLWPQIHSKDAEIAQLKEHTELLMKQLEAAEARALRAEATLHQLKNGGGNVSGSGMESINTKGSMW